MNHPLLASCFLALLGATLVPAAGTSEPQGSQHPCAAVQEADDRLACYDRTFGRSAEGEEAPPDAAGTVGRDFGLSEAEKRTRAPDPDKRLFLDQIEAAVTGVGYHGTGEMIITLDNEQVWVQAEPVTSARLRVGDKIIIRKAALGSYQLVTPGRIAMRVRRAR